MSTIVMDFETYYDKEYSLRRLNPVEYLHDPRFEMIGCAVKVDDKPSVWLDPLPFRVFVEKLRQKKHTVLSHNALFDMCILAWKYDYVPDLMVDTMSMSRAMLYAFTKSVSLEKVAEYLGLPPKIEGVIKNVSGMRAADIKAAGMWEIYKAYAEHDAELCRMIFDGLKGEFPREEYVLLDMVIRMAVEPGFTLEGNLLAEHAAVIEAHKANLLVQCGMTSRLDLMSNDKFAAALRLLGVEPDLKTSPKTGKDGYAFAKSDPFMIELEDHPDDRVQALAAARVGHKSTIEQTRTESLLRMSRIDWGPRGVGWAPIALRYGGAHTHRFSGDWKLNAQNWPRYTFNADGTKETGKLRRAHGAPKGKKVVKCDASQIEARIVAWLAGQWDLVGAFARGEDIYSDFAGSDIYHYPVSKETPDERFVGKSAILGLGFGLGHVKFAKDIAAKSYTTLGRSIIIDLDTSKNIVVAYRSRFREIPKAWRRLQMALPDMSYNKSFASEFGPCMLMHQCIVLPNGHKLFYHDLRQRVDDQTGKTEWGCFYGREPKKVYGGKVFENIVQALARIITMRAAMRMRTRFPRIPLRHQVHDDLVYIVPDEMVEDFKAALLYEMSKARDWYHDLPLAAEAGVGQNYGDAK